MTNREIFEKYQRWIIWLKNTTFGMWWFDDNEPGDFTPNLFGRWAMYESGRWKRTPYLCGTWHKRHYFSIHPGSIDWVVRINPNGSITCKNKAVPRDHYAMELYRLLRPLSFLLKIGALFTASSLQPAYGWLVMPFVLDTSTKNPDASPETTTVDGQCEEGTATTTWATIRDATDSDSASDDGIQLSAQIVTNATPAWAQFNRSIVLYDHSDVDDAATKDSCIQSVFTKFPFDNWATQQAITLVTSTPASNTAVTTADYDQLGTVKQSDTETLIDNISDESYMDYTLNATGLANISLTGVSKFGYRLKEDADDNPQAIAATKTAQVDWEAAEHTGGNDPKSVLQYTVAAAGGNQLFALMGVG